MAVLVTMNNCLLLLLFYYFYRCRGGHRDLHSFPTRRSSDLSPRQMQKDRPYEPDPPTSSAKSCRGVARVPSQSPTRSEEHTSELQSRRDLVCRLLLEKKNQE